MNMEKLFSTKERVAVLQDVIFSEKEIGVNEVARRLGLSKGLVSKYLEILEHERILERRNGKFAAIDSKEVKSVKIMHFEVAHLRSCSTSSESRQLSSADTGS